MLCFTGFFCSCFKKKSYTNKVINYKHNCSSLTEQLPWLHTFSLVPLIKINSVPPVPERGCVEQCSVSLWGLLSAKWPEASDPSGTAGSDSHSPDSCQLNLHGTKKQDAVFELYVFCVYHVRLWCECVSLTIGLVGGSRV